MKDRIGGPDRGQRPLAGLSIVVTRPAHQAEPLCRRLEAAGSRVIRLPALEIHEPADATRLGAVLDRLCECQLAIFVSANAVHHGLRSIRARGASLSHLRLAAIGRKTAQALTAAGYPPDIYPREDFTSEALLSQEPMQGVAGLRILVFRGEGGRELLADTLRARGAVVEYAEVYRRVKPGRPALADRLGAAMADLITITSLDALHNLDALCGPGHRAQLRAVPLLVGSQRVLEQARNAGYADARAARDASDEAMFEGVLAWAQQGRGSGG